MQETLSISTETTPVPTLETTTVRCRDLLQILCPALTCQQQTAPSLKKEVEQIHAVDFLAILEPQLAEIQQETAAEPVLRSLTQVIVKGWPEKKDDLLIELRPYFDVRDELTAQDGDLFKGLQCLILPSLRPKIHECLHGAHSGIKKKNEVLC